VSGGGGQKEMNYVRTRQVVFEAEVPPVAALRQRQVGVVLRHGLLPVVPFVVVGRQTAGFERGRDGQQSGGKVAIEEPEETGDGDEEEEEEVL
jgi:hypothetical protein